MSIFPLNSFFLPRSGIHSLFLSHLLSLTRIHRLSHTISFHCYHIFCLPPDFFSLTSTLIFTLFLSFFLSFFLSISFTFSYCYFSHSLPLTYKIPSLTYCIFLSLTNLISNYVITLFLCYLLSFSLSRTISLSCSLSFIYALRCYPHKTRERGDKTDVTSSRYQTITRMVKNEKWFVKLQHFSLTLSLSDISSLTKRGFRRTFLTQTLTLVAAMESPMLVGPLPCE